MEGLASDDGSAPVIDKGTVDRIKAYSLTRCNSPNQKSVPELHFHELTPPPKGVTFHGGVSRQSNITGGMLYHYVFQDAENEMYEIPCFVITAPLNML